MTSTSRTARCGPACRVVWEGRDGCYHRLLIPISYRDTTVRGAEVHAR